VLDKQFIIKNAIQKYGEKAQTIVAMEEMSELIKECSKAYRGELNRKNMIEEIADVLIMIDQLKEIYNLTDYDINDIINMKLLRLNHRVLDEEDD